VLRTKITTYLCVGFSAFMYDVHEELRILSESFQSNKLVVFDIANNVNRTLKKLKKLLEQPGKHQAKFLTEVAEVVEDEDSGAGRPEGMYLGVCQLFEIEAGKSALKKYRDCGGHRAQLHRAL
jgi:hypothetical protein